MTRKIGWAALAALAVLGVTVEHGLTSPAAAKDRQAHVAGAERPRQARNRAAASQPHHQVQRGRASYYGPRFNGRRMANGARFNPNSNVAAHRSLPLGTRAQVTNLENGRTTEVRVEDRGPYVRGRVIDLTPRTAEELGMRHQGVVPVEVRPIEVPDRDQRVAQR
ncbi:septal ring lytic transglycosylase RlpA family protein [Siccirubricoccus sp. KC 17139]|uniref:Endolytic peptidoglycan transglycosylase RlpA n=1 Tax=Siccirubricoccus soli TaxID=2899147 RepID=A0ABT1D808_9PROT|nr:septal ring lytic transglycosylase RlpA family protein [Siccirubricoccus soli]MCO6418071.1 septal ring lytic transglycosylase RlpA family protein [Siccirubricoccus soli]MCP2684206.1 septal ring lytic transglycosylase RlpA family protein [Siccirubricoccus soli]